MGAAWICDPSWPTLTKVPAGWQPIICYQSDPSTINCAAMRTVFIALFINYLRGLCSRVKVGTWIAFSRGARLITGVASTGS